MLVTDSAPPEWSGAPANGSAILRYEYQPNSGGWSTVPGAHRVVWDGRGRQGRAEASGVYLYRLQTPLFSQTRKMILLREAGQRTYPLAEGDNVCGRVAAAVREVFHSPPANGKMADLSDFSGILRTL